jgi:hypothetical protein
MTAWYKVYIHACRASRPEEAVSIKIKEPALHTNISLSVGDLMGVGKSGLLTEASIIDQ